jgi:hypothetical protein
MLCLPYQGDCPCCSAGQAILICTPGGRGECKPAAVITISTRGCAWLLMPWHSAAPLSGSKTHMREVLNHGSVIVELSFRHGWLRLADGLHEAGMKPILWGGLADAQVRYGLHLTSVLSCDVAFEVSLCFEKYFLLLMLTPLTPEARFPETRVQRHGVRPQAWCLYKMTSIRIAA